MKWISDCSYELSPSEELLAKTTQLTKDMVVTVDIKNTTDSSYHMITTSSFNDMTFAAEVVKMNNRTN